MNYKKAEAEYLLKLIAAAVSGGSPVAPAQGFDWENMHELAVLHKVESLAYVGLSAVRPAVDGEILKIYEESYKKAIVSDYIQHSEGVKLFKAFEQAGISCLPLKGWIIKDLYPQPVMRSMCDIDVLIHSDDSQRVNEIMLSMGYDESEYGKNPDIYFKKPVMNIEVHKALIQDKTDHFLTTWNRVTLKSGCNYIYEMSREDYYIFMMAHLKKHFTGTGTGIRSVVDVFIYLRKYENELNFTYIEEKLQKSGIWEFDRKIYALCKRWFGSGGSSLGENEMERELVFSAVYGTEQSAKDNTVSAQISAVSGGSVRSKKLRYALRLFFPGREIMAEWYPWAVRHPFFMPVAWIMRGTVCLFSRTRRIRSAIGDVLKADENKIKK